MPPLLLAAALAAGGHRVEGEAALRAHLSREPRCDHARAARLLGRGDAVYQRECARILNTLVSLGLPRPDSEDRW